MYLYMLCNKTKDTKLLKQAFFRIKIGDDLDKLLNYENYILIRGAELRYRFIKGDIIFYKTVAELMKTRVFNPFCLSIFNMLKHNQPDIAHRIDSKYDIFYIVVPEKYFNKNDNKFEICNKMLEEYQSSYLLEKMMETF